jgi:hypothetical protein
MTHLSNFLGHDHAWLLYLTNGNISNEIGHTPKQRAWIIVRLMPCPRRGARNIDDAWHSAVETVLSQLRYLDITGPGLKWDCAEGFQRQCYPLMAVWVRDYPEQVMIAQVSYCSCPMRAIPKRAPIGHSSF